MAKQRPATTADGEPAADLTAASKEDTVVLIAPEGCTGMSIRGMEFEVQEGGEVKAPGAFVAELISHGFTVKPQPRKARG